MSGTLAPEVGIILTVRIRSSVVGASLMVTTIFQSFGARANVQRQQQPIFCEPVATSPNLPFSQLLPVFAVTSSNFGWTSKSGQIFCNTGVICEIAVEGESDAVASTFRFRCKRVALPPCCTEWTNS